MLARSGQTAVATELVSIRTDPATRTSPVMSTVVSDSVDWIDRSAESTPAEAAQSSAPVEETSEARRQVAAASGQAQNPAAEPNEAASSSGRSMAGMLQRKKRVQQRSRSREPRCEAVNS